MVVSVFVGTSVDGFIARPNGALDFLPPDGGEPHGYAEFFASVDGFIAHPAPAPASVVIPNDSEGSRLP